MHRDYKDILFKLNISYSEDFSVSKLIHMIN